MILFWNADKAREKLWMIAHQVVRDPILVSFGFTDTVTSVKITNGVREYGTRSKGRAKCVLTYHNDRKNTFNEFVGITDLRNKDSLLSTYLRDKGYRHFVENNKSGSITKFVFEKPVEWEHLQSAFNQFITLYP